MPNFLIVPSANVNGGGEVTSLTGAVVDTDTTLAPLVNGTEYRAFALANPSPPFTPSAPASLSRTYLGEATAGFAGGVTSRSFTLPVTFNAGTRYVVAIAIQVDALLTAATLTIGGTVFERRVSSSVSDDGSDAMIFEGVPASNATTAVLDFGLTTTTYGAVALCYSITSTAVWQAGVASTATTGNQRDGSLNVGAGNLVIGVACAAGTTASLAGMTWAGLTADGFAASPSDAIGYAASAENVAAATPRTITADRVGTTNNNNGFQIAVGRWSAS